MSKVFVFDWVGNLTSRYHSDGGLVVVAPDEAAARALIATDEDIQLTDGEWQDVIVYDIVGDAEPRMFIFPDAGCC